MNDNGEAKTKNISPSTVVIERIPNYLDIPIWETKIFYHSAIMVTQKRFTPDTTSEMMEYIRHMLLD